jgi:hypothetical protein
MENMPNNVVDKIFYFTRHPVAEIVRASGIFKVLEHTNQEEYSDSFVQGAYAGYSLESFDPRHYKHLFEKDGTFHCRFHIEVRERLDSEGNRLTRD